MTGSLGSALLAGAGLDMESRQILYTLGGNDKLQIYYPTDGNPTINNIDIQYTQVYNKILDY
jgi:hypothetical protein